MLKKEKVDFYFNGGDDLGNAYDELFGFSQQIKERDL